MWRASQTFPLNITYLFSDWVIQPEIQEEISSLAQDEEPCLFDLLSLWVNRDPNVIDISSHASFLVGVLAIVGAWLSDDKTYVNGCALWRSREGGEPSVVEHLFHENQCGSFGADHPLLNPLAFDLARAQLEASTV